MPVRPLLATILGVLALFALGACHPAPPTWGWESRTGTGTGDSMQLRRDHADCFYYVMITEPQYGGAGDSPGIVTIFDWDEPMVACMARRGWLFVDRTATSRR